MSRGEFLKLLAAGASAAVLGGGAAVPGEGATSASPGWRGGTRAAVPSGGAASAAAGPLRTRPVPRTGEPLPVVGLGTWIVFDVGESEAERAPRREVLRLLLEGGGRVVDSSPMYGRAESVTGDLLAELGATRRAFLATKVWTTGRESGIEQMRRSKVRLRTDRIDLMQIHNLVDWRTHLPTLREMKARGEIRYIGITHYTSSALDDLARVIEQAPDIDFVQLAYSILERAAEANFLPFARDRGVAVLVNRPYEGGAVFRAVRGKPLPEWAAEFDCASWGQFFLKFILSHPAVTCVIPGTDNPRHMTDNLAAGRGRLPDAQQRKRMVEFWEALA